MAKRKHYVSIDDTLDDVPEPVPVKEPEPITCKSFLQNFLDGGPISRTNVYREAENASLNWEEVKQAFKEMNGREYVQRGDWYWRIMPE